MKRSVKIFWMFALFTFAPFPFFAQTFADNYGRIEVYRYDIGKTERMEKWPRTINLERNDRIIFVSNKVFGFEFGKYTAWVTSDINSQSDAERIEAYLNGRKARKMYFFETENSHKKAIWLFDLIKKDFSPKCRFKVTMINRGYAVKLKNVDFSDVPVACVDNNCGWGKYLYHKKTHEDH